jgi:hypothetical protein
MRKLITTLAAAAALAGGVRAAPAQQLLDNQRFIVIVQPQEWTGTGTRGIISTARPVRVRGKAHHPAGITRVEINGTAAATHQDATGATVFTLVIPGAAAAREVRIVAYPAQGEPITRVQKPDGTWQYAPFTAPPQATALTAPGALGGAARLRVSTGALPRADRDALVAALRGEPRIAVDAGAGAHLGIRRQGAEYLVTGADGAVRHHAPASRVDSLIPLLMREHGALQLVELPAPASAVPVEFTFPGGSEFRIGDGIEFRVRSSRAGYVTVVDLGTDGAISVLYPMLPADEAAVRAGEEVRLPSEAASAMMAPQPAYQAGEPAGTGVVRVFVTPRPLALAEVTGTLSADAVLRALRDATGGGTEPWGTATLTYRITPK